MSSEGEKGWKIVLGRWERWEGSKLEIWEKWENSKAVRLDRLEGIDVVSLERWRGGSGLAVRR